MSFGIIFWPVFTALMAAITISTAVSIGMQYYNWRRQKKRVAEYEEHLRKRGLDPEAIEAMVTMGGPPEGPGPFPVFGGQPTSSGSNGTGAVRPAGLPGQYI